MQTFTDKDIAQINYLLKQHAEDVDENFEPITKETLLQIRKSGHIETVRNKEGVIIGVGILVYFQVLTGFLGYAKNLIVDKDHRRKGVGRYIAMGLIKKAKEIGCRHVDFDSRPERKIANMAYQKAVDQGIGLEKRDTNMYRFRLR